MKRIRVLHVIQSLNYGGMERLVADMVRLADRGRFELHVLGLEYLGRFSEGLEPLATLHVGPRMNRAALLYPKPLADLIRSIAPDVVHTHSGVWLKAGRAARMARVPLTIHTEHGRRSPDPLTDRLSDRIASGNTDVVIAVSDLLAEQLARRVRIPRRKIRVILNGVDTDRYRPSRDPGLLAELGLPSNTPVVGSVGRLEVIKGYDVALEAFSLLQFGRHPPPVLVVMGDGSEREQLIRLAGQLGIADRVFLLGWRDDIHRLHATATVFTMSSRSEGTSVSLLEAMSAGLCPIVTDVGGNRAVLGPQLEDRLVPSEDPASLAQAWQIGLGDDRARERDAQYARERVIEHFSLERMVRAYEAIYARPEDRTRTPELIKAANDAK